MAVSETISDSIDRQLQLLAGKESDLLFERIELERGLNQHQYEGVGLGEMLSSHLKDYINYNRRPASWRSVIAAVAKDWASLLLKLRWQSGALPARKIYFSYYAGTPKDKILLAEVKRSFDPSAYAELIPSDYYTSIGLKDFWTWLGSAFQWRRTVTRELDNLHRDGLINSRERTILVQTALQYALRVKAVKSKLAKASPKLILFTHDRNRLNALVAASANALSIKTAVLIHGSSFHVPIGYLPVIAREVLCWGKLQKRIFEHYQTDGNRIHTVGLPSFSKDVRTEEQVRRLHGIPPNKKTILLATNVFFDHPYDEVDMTRAFVEAVEKAGPKWFPIVKVHPRKHAELEPRLSPLMTKGTLLAANCPVAESLALADVVASLSSTYAIEAMLCGKPVCVFNPTGFAEEGIGRYLHKFGEARYAQSTDQLATLLDETETNSMESVFNHERVQEYAHIICEEFGAASSRAIVQTINAFTEN